MNTLNFVGNISLNLSSFLYLILLIPQLVHNRKSKNLAGLSLWLHFFLYTSYSFDLVYGIADGMPLQYKVVSVVGLFLVMTQHMQLLKFHIKQRCFFLIKIELLFVVCHLFFSYCFFAKLVHGGINSGTILLLGVIARGCEIIYCIPQIFKNHIAKSANAVSLHFIYLNILLALLDMAAAWCLDWELPNKVAPFVNIMIMLIILLQYIKYSGARRNEYTQFTRQSKFRFASAA